MSNNIREFGIPEYHRHAMITHEQIIRDSRNKGIVKKILPNKFVRSIFLGLILALIVGLFLLPAIMSL